jgi:hypothetical protein
MVTAARCLYRRKLKGKHFFLVICAHVSSASKISGSNCVLVLITGKTSNLNHPKTLLYQYVPEMSYIVFWSEDRYVCKKSLPHWRIEVETDQAVLSLHMQIAEYFFSGIYTLFCHLYTPV